MQSNACRHFSETGLITPTSSLLSPLSLTSFSRRFGTSSPFPARETYAEAGRVYALLGAPDKLYMFEADNTHGYSLPRRLAAYEWLSRWLKGSEDHTPEQEVKVDSAEELRCTPSGQV